MILYHFSDHDVVILKPKIGDFRHKGEDSRAVDKPVIWLTTRPDSKDEEKYRYTVEINKNDPHLYADKGFNNFMDQVFEQGEIREEKLNWFFYTSDIKPIKKEKWNGITYQ